ncbi:MAG: gliding motility-associated C-terminal domain-containing protein [Flavobacteriales bacterium]|nr:gliding motility-associated C-terminal domain-containing protein [Flavobacteriales bacterium]
MRRILVSLAALSLYNTAISQTPQLNHNTSTVSSASQNAIVEEEENHSYELNHPDWSYEEWEEYEQEHAEELASQTREFYNSDTVVLHSTVVPMDFMGITPNLRDVRTVDMSNPVQAKPRNERGWPKNDYSNPNPLPQGKDPALQTDYPAPATNRATSYNWEGIGYTSVNPGDPTLDVGPNHVVQMLNGSSGTKVQIFDKTGTALTGVVNMSTLCGTTAGDGDPIVMYDERADRWVLTEFLSSGNRLLIAVSTTPDPTGSYYTYSVTSPGGFPDYPKYSIWEDSYICTANVGSSDIFAFDRNSMLTGGAANTQYFTQSNYGTISFQAATPVSLNGTTNPPSGAPAMVMRMRDDAWTGVSSDALEIWNLDIDWVTPGNSTFSQSQVLGIAAYDSDMCGYTTFNCIPQPGTTTKIDPLREVLMNRIHYRNFGTHESIVCCHVTDVDGTDHAGIRWYELRRTGGAGSSWTIYQQGTYAPDSHNRFMASIGISATGNIGLMFNISSSTIYPSIRYTGRKVCDPLNVMTEPETVIITGAGSQGSGTGGRYGDYNSMGLDPVDGETFYCTAMYNPSSQWSTRNAAFKIASCNPIVQFDNSTYTVNEADANVVSGCMDYYTLNVPISITIDPSQPADITINVSGGTATQNVDYTISGTNLTLDGSTLTGSATILVYDDYNVEGDETIILDYTLNANGGDAAAGTTNQTVTITIIDNDLDPSIFGSTNVIFSEDFESGFGSVTTSNPGGGASFQIGDEATAQTTAYNIPSDNATQFAYVNDDDCNCNMNNVYLYLPSLDLSLYSVVTINFDSYFEDNTYSSINENADLIVSTDGGATFTTVGPLVASGIDVSWTSQSFDVSAYVGNPDVIFAILYSDAGGWLYGCSIDNLVVTGTIPNIDIQTAVNTGTGMTGNLGPNETVHFYDPTSGDIMISLENTSSFDYGCVTVEVDRDGTAPTALEFNSAAVADYLHGKTYKVVPTNNSTSDSYNITLYYKEAEVAAWESITGNSRTNLEIIKVEDATINTVTPANYSSYTIENLTATLGTFNSDVTLTSSFTTGLGGSLSLSGFGAGIYNLPTSLSHTAIGTDPQCNGDSNGSITFSVSGGTPPYEYSTDGGSTWTTSNPVTGLASGTYSTVVRDVTLTTSTPVSVTLTNPSAISMSSSGSNPICNPGTGSINITASGGTGTLQYSIDGGTSFQATGSFTGLAANTYNIIVEDINGCQASGSESISLPPAITMSSTSSDPACSSGTGSITITASGGTGSLQYSIDGGTSFQGTGNFTGLASGAYNIVVKDVNNCQVTGSETITIPNVISISSSATDATCGNNDGTITITASGGTGTLQYSIDGGTNFQSGNSFSGLAANSYSIVVQDANSCQQTSSETVANTAGPSISGVNTNDASCNGGNDGDLTISATGTATLQYSIDGGTTFQSSSSFSGLTTSTYNIVVEDGNNCQSNTTATVGEPAANTFNTTSSSPSCVGGSNGSITFSGATGPNPKRYSINGGTTFVNNTNFTGLSAGTYNVAYRDGNGCVVYATVVISDPTPISITPSTTAATCGSSDGSITITATGGTGTLQYSIDGGSTFQTGSTFNSLASGSYNIVVKDANNCQEISTANISTTSGPSISSVTTNDVSCNGVSDGDLSISATGTATLEYSIDGGSSFQTSNSFNGLGGASYAIVVKDGNGCQSSTSATIVEPSAITVSSTSTAENCGNNDGSISITASGGTGALQYSIDGGTTFQGTGAFSGLNNGSYNIVVRDGNSCQSNSSVSVGINNGPMISSVSDSDPTCFGGTNGTITFTASGVGTLEYSVNGGTSWQTSNIFTGLSAATYNLYIKDGAGCTLNVGTLTLNQPSQISYTPSITNETCGNGDGIISLAGSGGTGALQYSINGGSSFQSSGTFSGLSSGSYNIVIKDAANCQITNTESVGIINGPTISSENSNDVSCNGSSDGSIAISATGTATLQFSIDGGINYASTSMFTGLGIGNYDIAVIDGNGCVTMGSTLSIGEPLAVTYSSTISDESCIGNDGSIVLSGNGGNGGYQYSINGGSSFQGSGTFNSLSSGTYNILVKDANNCQIAGTETINTTTGPIITNESRNDVSCNGGNDGSISITATGIGTLEYSIDGGSNFTTSGTFNGLSAGTYNVVVKDGNGCTTIGSTMILGEPTSISYTAMITNASCGNSNGSISISASGGTGALQYSINGGTTFQSSSSFSGLIDGSYNVVIKDNNGCLNSGTEVINTTTGPAVGSVTNTNITCNGAANGTITITATGTATLQYSVNGGATYQSSNSFSGLNTGNYNVIVQDGNGCTSSGGSITISEPTSILISTSSMDATCGSNNGSITISATGGTGTLQYSIDGGTTFQSSGTFTGLSTGTYNVVVQDANGCQVSSIDNIGSATGPSITNETFTDVSCNGADDATIVISATGNNPLNYSINGGATFTSSGVFTNLASGTYNIVVRDGSGCITNGSSVTITEPSVISFSTNITNATCGVNDGEIEIIATGGTGTLLYSNNGGGTFQSSNTFTGIGSGSYNIVVEDGNNCQQSGTAAVNSVPGPGILSSAANNISCYGNIDGSINIVASGVAPLSYSIDGGSTYQASGSFSGLDNGTYVVTVQDANGCSTNSSSLIISEPSAIAINTSTSDATCGNSDGSITIAATGGTGTLQYSIDAGSSSQGLGAFTNIMAGTYNIVVEDANACQSTNTVMVINADGPIISSLNITDESCFGLNDGSVDVTATGTAPLTYSFNSGVYQSSGTYNGSTGTVTIDVQDGNGCIVSSSADIASASQITITGTATDAVCGQNNGYTAVVAAGGTGSYAYLWDDPLAQTNNVATNLAAGIYQVMVTDGNGCIDSLSLTVNSSSTMVVNVDVTHESCPNEQDGIIATSVTGGQPPYDYIWSNGSTTAVIENLGVGNYTLTVSDDDNCIVSLIIPIENEGGDCIHIPTAISPNADGSNDTWVIGGLSDYPEAVVEIYNRWGSLLYSSSDYQNDWDGTYNGDNVSAGVYYYVIKLNDDITYTGSLTVIR